MSTYEISKSSLLSLKAEILRKQEELSKSKLQNQVKKAQLKKLTPLEVKNKGIELRELCDVNEEDENLLKKSRAALETKARLYDKLSKCSNFTDELECNRFLVRFDKKNFRGNNVAPEDSDGEMDVNRYEESDEDRQDYESAKNPEEEWVEYTDCLGRTRTCMRKDLEFLKSKDADLRIALDKNENKSEQLVKPIEEPQEMNGESKNNIQEGLGEESELLSSNTRRELLRRQWEKEENELRKKNDIHYQDILFNEARTHGVGYYGFSKDEEERAKQQEALKNLRQETEQEQKKAQELRALREKQLAARVKAARNRKRARMGLPPEENEPEIPQQEETSNTDEEEQKKKLEEEKKEQQKDATRKKHIRPWDIGKEGVRKHYEQTQEEWVAKKRKERIQEFAPPNSYKRSFRSEPEAKDNDSELDNKRLFFSTKKIKTGESSKKCSSFADDSSNRAFFVDTSKPPPDMNSGHTNPYKTKISSDYCRRNSVPVESTPIINECTDFDDEQDRLLADYKSTQQSREKTDSLTSSDLKDDLHCGRGAEIAPPATFDYYGSNSVKMSTSKPSKGNLEDSIAAGLKFLRRQAEKKDSSSKHPSEMYLL